MGGNEGERDTGQAVRVLERAWSKVVVVKMVRVKHILGRSRRSKRWTWESLVDYKGNQIPQGSVSPPFECRWTL